MHFQFIILFSPILRSLAYLDPGSGSFIVQLVIAAIVGAGVFIKVFWKKIKGLFTRTGSKQEDDDQTK